MAVKTIGKVLNGTRNEAIANAIRNGSSKAYADAVPLATGDNIKEVASAILSNQAYTNEFLSNLMNRIGRTIMESKVWTNPLSKFKEGLLEFGEVTQEIFVNRVKQEFYSMWDAQDKVFKVAVPDVRAVYYEMNDQMVYTATINESMIRQAFLSQGGVMKLVEGIIDRMSQENEVHEYLVMKNLMTSYANQGKFYPVKVTAPTTEATAKSMIQKIREYYRKLTFVSNEYNYVGVDTHSIANDIHLFISADMEALVDVEVLARAFNMDKTEFLGHVTVLDNMPIANCYAIMVDKSWFRVYDNKISSDVIYNPKGLYNNHFLHHWETFAVNPFANAILFTSNDSAVTSLNFVNASGTPTTAFTTQADTSINLKTSIVVTGSAKKTCNFEITEGLDYVAEFTSTGDACEVKVKPSVATSSIIKVKAISQADKTKTDTATITIIA